MDLNKINESLNNIANLLEGKIPDWVCQELERFNYSAGRRLDKSIEPYLEPFKPKRPITLYRGLGFDLADGVSVLKKLKIKGNEGDKGYYKTGKVQSWSASEEEAREFMGLHGFAGIKIKDSLGILLKATIKPGEILAPIGKLPKYIRKKCIRYDQDEYLLHPGTFKIEVVDLFGQWPDPNAKDPKKVINDFKKKLKSLLGDNIKVGPTRNKSPGFSVKLLDYPVGSRSRTKLLYPSIEFLYQDGKIDVSIMGGEEFSKYKTGVNSKKVSPEDAIDFIEKDLAGILKSAQKAVAKIAKSIA